MTSLVFQSSFRQGETWSHVFQWLQADRITPVDMTGYTGSFKILQNGANKGAGSFLLIDAAAGRFGVALGPTVTQAQAAGQTVDGIVTLVSPAGDVKKPAGALKVLHG